MAKIVMRKRHLLGKYATCPECGHEHQLANPIELDLPYCGACGHAVDDGGQRYCGWCGERFESAEAKIDGNDGV